MYAELVRLIAHLDDSLIKDTNVIQWASPVPSFGDLSNALIATLGLNPSNLEFLGSDGIELSDLQRRFHTLSSLNLLSWGQAKRTHVANIIESCKMYFQINPYDRWFRRLDHIVRGTGYSFYGPKARVVHLDLIPYSTEVKWTDLKVAEKNKLFTIAGDSLGLLVRDSPIQYLILNGQAVVNQFQEAYDVVLEKSLFSAWALPRKNGKDVTGYAYKGQIRSLYGIRLSHPIKILGYNHNIQSSFGVTRKVQNEIRRWISRNI